MYVPKPMRNSLSRLVNAGRSVACLTAGLVAIAACVSAEAAPVGQAPSETAISTQLGTVPTSQVESTSESRPRASVNWKMSLSSDAFTSQTDRAQMTSFGLHGNLKYRLLPALAFRGAAVLKLQSGFASSRFGDIAPRNGIDLREATLRMEPVRFMEIAAGAIDQGDLQSDLLVSSRAFPGVSEAVRFGTPEYIGEIRAQQVIPTSNTMTTKSVDTEPTPSLFTETFSFTVRPNSLPFRFSVYGTHFRFSELPSAVARESDVLGNSIIEITPAYARFAFEFEGWLAGIEGAVKLGSSVIWKVKSQMVQNQRALSSYRNGQLVSTSLKIRSGDTLEIEPGASTFFVESDAVPAYYNGAEFGHTNRQGWSGELGATFKSAGFRVLGSYVDAKVLQPNVLQTDQRYLMLRFETLYEVL